MTKSTGASWKDSPMWRRVFFWCFVAVIATAGVMGGYTLAKPMRAQQLATQALELLDKGDLKGARTRVMAAHSLAPRRLPVARAMAQVWGRIAPESVAPLWEKVVEISKGEKADRQQLALAYMAAGELERARGVIAELMTEDSAQAQTQFVQANWLMATLRPAEAMERLEPLLRASPANASYWQAYRLAVFAQPQPPLERYRRQLEALKTDRGPLGLWALAELARLSDKKELEAALAELLRHPQASRQETLLAWELRYRTAGLAIKELRRGVQRSYNLALKADRQELARYYRALGDAAGVLEVISPKMAAEDRDDLMLYLDGLAGTNRWQAILEILSVKKLPLEEYWREIFRARAWAALGKPQEATLAWRKALVEAGNDTEKLSDIAQYLVALGAIDEVNEVMPRLIENSGPLEQTLHMQRWLQLLITTRDTVRAQSLLAQMTARSPQNLPIKNDYIYYSLLLKKPGNWVKEAYELATQAPAVVAHRMTLSLALYRAGDFQKAYEVIRTTRITNWETVPVGWQLVRAAILKQVGQPVPAVKNAEAALPEERAL